MEHGCCSFFIRVELFSARLMQDQTQTILVRQHHLLNNPAIADGMVVAKGMPREIAAE